MVRKRPPTNASVEWLRRTMARYEGPLLAYATTILGDRDRATEVVQETFLRMWHRRRHASEDHIGPWLFTVCRNHALDVRRKERRMSPLGEDAGHNHASGQPTPSALAERQEAATQVAQALRSLPANQQEVLRLKFENGFSYRQIAGITGLSPSNVGYLIHTGIRSLRETFRALGLIGQA